MLSRFFSNNYLLNLANSIWAVFGFIGTTQSTARTNLRIQNGLCWSKSNPTSPSAVLVRSIAFQTKGSDLQRVQCSVECWIFTHGRRIRNHNKKRARKSENQEKRERTPRWEKNGSWKVNQLDLINSQNKHFGQLKGWFLDLKMHFQEMRLEFHFVWLSSLCVKEEFGFVRLLFQPHDLNRLGGFWELLCLLRKYFELQRLT